jgi:hypothetical protein
VEGAKPDATRVTRAWPVATLTLMILGAPGPAFAQWESPSRAFHKDTRFPLDGRHLTVACDACHLSGVTKGTPTSCYECHWVRRQDDLYRTRLGPACEQCHRPTSWTAVRWDHATATGVALSGVHRTISCEACHKGARFTSATSGDCLGCHRSDYDRTKNPNHATAGFSTACESCHRASDATWHAAVNHTLFFALVGRHSTVDCSACHANGVFAGTPTDCFSCHRSLYDRTTNPNHVAASFPTGCEACHYATDATWTQGRFTHTLFPIKSGAHAGNACSACHTNPTSYAVFSCVTGCHARSKTDSQHQGRGGYRYDSSACYACHPSGKAG